MRQSYLAEFAKHRYASWDTGIGANIEAGKVGIKELEACLLKKGEATAGAGRSLRRMRTTLSTIHWF